MSKWKIADVVFGVVGGVCSIAGILTAIKCTEEDDKRHMEQLEEKYGLTPVEEAE